MNPLSASNHRARASKSSVSFADATSLAYLPYAVRKALNGVNRAYFVYPIRPGLVQATAQFAQLALEAGVEGIVNMSQISARGDAKSHSAREHWLAEQVFDWSGLNVAHIRPTYFAEWLLYLAPMIRQGVMYAPFSTGPARARRR
jgi:NAD(P)H dehydrogenase (quinone)